MRKLDFPRLQECFYEQVLPNGLTVRVLPKPRFDKLYAVLAVNYGSVDMDYTADGTTVCTPAGVAHYLEHKMFDLPEGNAMQGFTELGGSPNAFTGYEMTAYHVGATSHFEENLRLLLHMVMTPCFTDESVEKERGIIAEEIKMYADSADSQVYERLFALMYPDHPVRVPIAGSVESIQEITSRTLTQCYEAFYRPSNMILCVEGNLPPERVIQIALEETPAAMQAAATPCPIRQAQPTQGGLTRREMDIAMPMFTVGIRLPDLCRGDAVTEIACDLAAELVAGEASCCYQRLYEAGLIDTSFFSGFESVRELAMFSFGGDSEDYRAVCNAVFDEARRLVREGIDQTELDRLKRSAIGRRLRELDSFTGTCNRVCGYFFDGVEYFRFREAFDAVSQEDILAILRQLDPARAFISLIVPRKSQ